MSANQVGSFKDRPRLRICHISETLCVHFHNIVIRLQWLYCDEWSDNLNSATEAGKNEILSFIQAILYESISDADFLDPKSRILIHLGD